MRTLGLIPPRSLLSAVDHISDCLLVIPMRGMSVLQAAQLSRSKMEHGIVPRPFPLNSLLLLYLSLDCKMLPFHSTVQVRTGSCTTWENCSPSTSAQAHGISHWHSGSLLLVCSSNLLPQSETGVRWRSRALRAADKSVCTVASGGLCGFFLSCPACPSAPRSFWVS